MLRVLAVGVILLALGLFLPQSSGAEGPPAIRIGATVSLSGRLMEPSEMVRNAMRLWEKQVNARGGLLGRKVKLVLYDDKSRADLARSLYRKLVDQDKVDLVLSPYGTSLTLAASEVTESRKVVMVAGPAAGDPIWQRGYKYIFGVHAPAERYLIGFLDVIARQGLEKVAVIYEETPFNKATAAGAKEWAGRLGLKVVFFQAYRRGKQNFPRLLGECRATRPDALILCSYPQDSHALMAALAQIKYRPKALCETIGPAMPSFYELVGETATGVFGPSQWEPDTRIPFPGSKEFIKNFKAFNHKTPSYHAASAFAACQILERAVTHNQSLDQDKLRDYILSLETVTISGRFRVDGTGMQMGHDTLLIQWQNGKKEIVYPTVMQTAAPRF